MNPVLANPDIKINMSLDEIIYFTKGEINSQLHRRNVRGLKKKKKTPRNGNSAAGGSHSVPLMESTTGLDIYVSSHSPLLNAENKRRICQAVTNRALNSNLLQKSKEIIPAEYKLVKTTLGVERVLVPALDKVKPQQEKLKRPRKLNKNFGIPKQNTNSQSLPDKPPPLVAAPIFMPTKTESNYSNDDVIIDNSNIKKEPEVIDITSDLGDDILQAKKLCIPPAGSMYQMRTLNDRFTMLCGTFQF